MIIDCIADLHGHLPKLDGGDLLIVSGDLTASDKTIRYIQFSDWLLNQEYTRKIVIGGNHDNYIVSYGLPLDPEVEDGVDYLQDSGIEFQGLKVWGSPWTSRFDGINSACCAFTKAHDLELNEHWDLIPDDIDILITHGPPYGMLDQNSHGECCGSKTLRSALDRVKPMLHIFGHIHEKGGQQMMYNGSRTWCVNCSIMNHNYKPVFKPVRIEL